MDERSRGHARSSFGVAFAALWAAAACSGRPPVDRVDGGENASNPQVSGAADSGLADLGEAEAGSSGSGQADAGPIDSSVADAAPVDSGLDESSPTRDASGSPCVTSAAKGSCGPYLYPAIAGSDGTNTTVGQDVWNPIAGWSQTLHATDPGNWYVTADMPAGNTAVVSFPNTGETYDSSPLAGFSSIVSSFSEEMNATTGTSAEAAYDVWLNDWNDEVMIQHDMVNRGGPCGPVLATVAFGGHGAVSLQNWNLCQYGSELIWQVVGKGSQYGEHSASVDVLAMLNWLADNGGYLPKGSSLTAIGYGFEICSTGGVDETFRVTGFSITSSP